MSRIIDLFLSLGRTKIFFFFCYNKKHQSVQSIQSLSFLQSLSVPFPESEVRSRFLICYWRFFSRYLSGTHFFFIHPKTINHLFFYSLSTKISLFSLTYNWLSCCMALCDTYLRASYVMKSMEKTSLLLKNFPKSGAVLAVCQKNDSCVYVSKTVSGKRNQSSNV